MREAAASPTQRMPGDCRGSRSGPFPTPHGTAQAELRCPSTAGAQSQGGSGPAHPRPTPPQSARLHETPTPAHTARPHSRLGPYLDGSGPRTASPEPPQPPRHLRDGSSAATGRGHVAHVTPALPRPSAPCPSGSASRRRTMLLLKQRHLAAAILSVGVGLLKRYATRSATSWSRAGEAGADGP